MFLHSAFPQDFVIEPHDYIVVAPLGGPGSIIVNEHDEHV